MNFSPDVISSLKMLKIQPEELVGIGTVDMDCISNNEYIINGTFMYHDKKVTIIQDNYKHNITIEDTHTFVNLEDYDFKSQDKSEEDSEFSFVEVE